MLYAYATTGTALVPLAPQADLSAAIWVDLYRPLGSQATAVAALDYEIPTLADMEEIELSNRLYMDRGTAYMTAVLPGQLPEGGSAAMPVTFILNARRLVTARHHAPRPFETFPRRADRGSTGCDTPERVFLGLIEEIVGRLADLSEGVGKVLDRIAGRVLSRDATSETEFLQDALVTIGQQAELLGHVRMGLLSLDRILVYHAAVTPRDQAPRGLAKGIQRDIQALEVHADFLGSRVSLAVDTTLGMINLEQNNTVRGLSVVAALFLPPTLIASIYGMNFESMPELDEPWGYPMAIALMAATAGATWLVLRWKRWL